MERFSIVGVDSFVWQRILQVRNPFVYPLLKVLINSFFSSDETKTFPTEIFCSRARLFLSEVAIFICNGLFITLCLLFHFLLNILFLALFSFNNWRN